MRISDWSSDVCSSDLCAYRFALSWRDRLDVDRDPLEGPPADRHLDPGGQNRIPDAPAPAGREQSTQPPFSCGSGTGARPPNRLSVELDRQFRSEEHTSELQSLMRISYAVFCLKKKNNTRKNTKNRMIIRRIG